MYFSRRRILQNDPNINKVVKINTDTVNSRNSGKMQSNLSLEDINLCKRKKGKTKQLTFGIMLVYFKECVQFPSKANPISTQLLLQVAKYLDIDPINIMSFDWSVRTGERYRQDIRQYLGYRISNAKDIELAIGYLVDNLVPRHLSDSVLLDKHVAILLKIE